MNAFWYGPSPVPDERPPRPKRELMTQLATAGTADEIIEVLADSAAPAAAPPRSWRT